MSLSEADTRAKLIDRTTLLHAREAAQVQPQGVPVELSLTPTPTPA